MQRQDIQKRKSRSDGSGKGLFVSKNRVCPFWHDGYVSLEHFSVHHPKQQSGFLIVYGIVVDVGTVSNLTDAAAVKEGFVVAGDNLCDGHVVTTFHHPTGNARGIDGRMACSYEEETDEEASLVGTTDIVKFVVSRKNSLEYQAFPLSQAILAHGLAILHGLHNGIGRVPVAKPVLGYLVGIDINGILHPLMLKDLRGDGCLTRAVWPGNDDKDGFVSGGYHAAEIFWASCRNCSKKRLVASSLLRLASSAASRISCESMASEGSSMLVSRYVSIVGVITLMFGFTGAKVQNIFQSQFKTK